MQINDKKFLYIVKVSKIINLSEILPQGNSRFITGGDGNITLQQAANDSTNTLPTGTVLAVRTAPTSSVDQVTLPSIPAPNILT